MRFLILVCLLVGTISYAGNETTERNKVKNHAYTLFAEERFDELEQLFIDFRNGDAKTASGTLKFPLIHQGIELTSAEIDKGRELDRKAPEFRSCQSGIRVYPHFPR